MAPSALPVSRSALDRLGERLAADEQVSDEDMLMLAEVVGAYQAVLDGVKAQIVDLGFEATTRVKTTPTLVDKLRREGRMRLSQVQDLAGARIIVAHRPAQDEAAAKLNAHFEADGNSCKIVDRRAAPSYGYRALHLVVNVGGILVEIQVRTDLEDTWAQIVERLADRWGRGIRYGQDPAQPDSIVRAGGQVFSRRQAMTYLTELASAVAAFEVRRGALIMLGEFGNRMKLLLAYFRQFPEMTDSRNIAELPADEQEAAQTLAAGLSLIAPPEARSSVAFDPRATTMATVFEAMGHVFELNHEQTAQMLGDLRERERELRDTLQLIASATDEGE